MKNNLGITMIELVIVVVIILIIASFAVASGRETLNEADISEVFVEMTSVKTAINGVIAKQNMDDDFEIEQGKQYDATFTPATGVTYSDAVLGNQDKWFIIFGRDNEGAYDASDVKDFLGLDAINHTYIVNYETVDVELYKPVTIGNIMVRTYEEVRGLAEK